MKHVVVFSILVLLALTGCGSSEKSVTGSINKEPVKTSGKKPDWVTTDKTYWTEDGRMWFRVMTDNEPDLGFAIAGLPEQAYPALINTVKVRAGLEFDGAVKGSKYDINSIGQARQSVVNAVGDVKFSDFIKEREYWEQYEKNEGMSGVSYVHTLYALYSISEKEMARAKEEAWNKAEGNVERQPDKDAKKILEESKARFLAGESK